ncbi:hypothetical protein EBZ38_15060 [bacterium]|nr:hypothetical protein [bacterium]
MANTYTLIASNTLSTTAASVTFSSIPSTYTDLVLRMSARNDRAVTNGTLNLTINNLSTSIYSWTFLQGNGSAASSNRNSATTFLSDIPLVGSSATSNTFSSIEIYLPSYLASQNKPVGIFGVNETNATAIEMKANAGLIQSTAAIDRIDISNTSTFQFVSGSSFFLYGIKNS